MADWGYRNDKLKQNEEMQICSSCFRKNDAVQRTNDSLNESYGRLDNKPTADVLQTRFYCCGRVPPAGVYRKRHGMCESVGSKRDDSVEVAAEAEEDQNYGITRIDKPDVPYLEDLPEELYQGRALEVHGKLLENASRFSINLSTGRSDDSDLGLHFNPRFDRRVVIRNHRIKNKWGVEEIVSLHPFPFKTGRNFSVLIFVADEQFLIAVNKIHFCAFAFRIPVDRIKSIIVLGDITLNYVQHCDVICYPPRIFKKTPFIIIPYSFKNENSKCGFRRKIKAIRDGSKIDIFGRLKLLPQAFYINLQKGIALWPHPIIPFHMNLRLHEPGTHKKEREIIFNSWFNGFWGKEETISLCPFLPGYIFHLRILCEPNSFIVFVNGKFLFNYHKRGEIDIDSVVIHGDVVVSKVSLR